jgi:two-component system OmpR family response regulator
VAAPAWPRHSALSYKHEHGPFAQCQCRWPQWLPTQDPPLPLNIVLIEDHAEFREQLCNRLQIIDDVRVVHTEATALAARQWLAEHPHEWDVLVVDLFLASGHGFQVLAAAKDRLARQQAVLLTSYTRDPVREQARKFGADAVFDKAFELSQFLAHVEGCCKAKDREVREGSQQVAALAA